MESQNSNDSGIVTSVGSLGKNFQASDGRAYWNQPKIYNNPLELANDWGNLVNQSSANRRVMMRTIVTNKLATDFSWLPIEAAIPVLINGDEEYFLIYLGKNNHQQVSQTGNETYLQPNLKILHLRPEFTVDTKVNLDDAPNLYKLWEQFGWTKNGVETFASSKNNTIIVVRNSEGKVVGAMIAENLEFGPLNLVEITEMAVLKRYQNLGLSKVLIQQLSALCFKKFGKNSLVYGEFNLSTYAHAGALAAGMSPAVSNHVNGVLIDHVSIKTGSPKQVIHPWNTQYLHSFQVMYWGYQKFGLIAQLR